MDFYIQFWLDLFDDITTRYELGEWPQDSLSNKNNSFRVLDNRFYEL